MERKRILQIKMGGGLGEVVEMVGKIRIQEIYDL